MRLSSFSSVTTLLLLVATSGVLSGPISVENRNKNTYKNTNTTDSSDSDECSKPSSAEAWGAGIGFSVLTSVTSTVGVLAIPVITTKTHRNYIIPGLVAFGAGSLVTTSVGVLIPEAFDLHAHGHGAEGDDDHTAEADDHTAEADDHADETAEEHAEHAEDADEHAEEDEDSKLYLKRGSVILAGVLFFFLLQQVFRHSHHSAHHMPHYDETSENGKKGNKKSNDKDNNNNNKKNYRSAELFSDEDYTYDDDSSYDYESDYSALDDGGAPLAMSSHAAEAGIGPFLADTGADPRTAGWINLAADGVHNLTDGLILGAMFTQSVSRGIAVFLPIMIHELAQEFGDFAFLLHVGFPRWRALGFNVLSGFVALIGTIAGLAIGESSEDANPWIAAFAAGGFLFVGLSLMLPEILHMHKNHMSLVVQATSFTFGIIVTFLIVFYVDDELINSDC